MYIKPPKIIKRLFPNLIWNLTKDNDPEKVVYITFDDGPTPDITLWILNTLEDFNAKATFFCLGKNVEMYPDLFEEILKAGHAVGNHSYSHLKGWGMPTGRYVEDVDLADNLIHSNLFRPPYGRIYPRQAYRLSERYNLIMWDVLSRDYSSFVTPKKCIGNVINNVRNGSIVVFHDSNKSFKNLKQTLPEVLQFFKDNGYECKSIEL